MENSSSVSLTLSEPRQYTTDSLSFSKQTTSQQHHIWASTSSSSFDTQSNYSSTDLSRTHQYFNNVSTTIFTFVTDLIFDNSAANWTSVACDYTTGNNISNESCSDVASNSSSSTSNVDDVASVALATFLTVVAATLAAFTAGTNLLVIIAFKTHKRLQTVSNYFLVSLSVADLAIGALSMPLFTLYLALGHWPLGDVICDIWLSIDYTVCNASVANLLLICLDRYLSISHPLSYRARRSGRLVVSMIIVAWLISFLLWTPWIVAWQFIEGKRTVPATECYIQFLYSNKYVTVGTAMLAFYLPVSVMCALYWRIYARTRRRHDDVSKLQAFKFKADSAATPAGEAGTGTATQTTTSQPSTGALANNNNNGTAGTCTTAVVSRDAAVESDLEQPTSKVKVRGLERESSVVTFSPSVLSSCDRPPHTITALTLASCNEYTDVSRQFQNDVTDICKQTSTDASTALLQNGNDCINSAYVTNGNGFSIDSKNEVEFRRLKQFRRSAPDIWACECAADNSVRGSKSHDDLECDLNLDLGAHEPALTTLMRWPSVAEMRSPASQQQAMVAAASGVNNGNKFCTVTRQEIVPVSAQEYLYNVEMDDMSNSGMTYINTGDFDDSTSDNGTSSIGYRDSHLRVNGIAGECTPTQTFCSVLATKFRGVRTRDGGATSGSLPRTAPAALYTRRQKRRQAKAKESKAAKTLSAILVAFIVTWLPYNVFIIFEAFSPGFVPLTLYNAGYWLCYINSTVNPICYVLCNANFRRALKNLAPGLRHVPRAPPPRLFPARRR